MDSGFDLCSIPFSMNVLHENETKLDVIKSTFK